jgi:hypothetical protein
VKIGTVPVAVGAGETVLSSAMVLEVLVAFVATEDVADVEVILMSWAGEGVLGDGGLVELMYLYDAA